MRDLGLGLLRGGRTVRSVNELARQLMQSAVVLNDQSPSFARATTAFDPAAKTTVASGARRRRQLVIGGRSVGLDLIEGARTNLLLRSQELENATWVKADATVSADATAAPDGTSTADRLVEAATVAAHQVTQQITKAASALVYCFTVYAKAAERRYLLLTHDTGAAGAYVTFDLLLGTISGAATTFGAFTAASAAIEAVGNGWYRCHLRSTTDTGTAFNNRIRIGNIADLSGGSTGDGTSGVYVWGAQLEQAAFPSSYIVTTTAAATRNADSLTNTYTLAVAAGTVLSLAIPYGWTADQDGATAYTLWRDSSALGHYAQRLNATTVDFNRSDAAGNQTAPLVHNLTHGVLSQLGGTWSAAAVTGYVAGVAGVADSTLTPPFANVTAITTGHRNNGGTPDRHFFGWVANLHWPRALSASELLALYTAAPIA